MKRREQVQLLKIEAESEVKNKTEKLKNERAKANDMKKEAESKLEEARNLLKESGKQDKKARRREVINIKKHTAESEGLLQYLKKCPKMP